MGTFKKCELNQQSFTVFIHDLMPLESNENSPSTVKAFKFKIGWLHKLLETLSNVCLHFVSRAFWWVFVSWDEILVSSCCRPAMLSNSTKMLTTRCSSSTELLLMKYDEKRKWGSPEEFTPTTRILARWWIDSFYFSAVWNANDSHFCYYLLLYCLQFAMWCQHTTLLYSANLNNAA